MQRNYRVFKNPFALLVLTSESILPRVPSLATDTALLAGLCCSVWEGSSCDRTGPGGTITPQTQLLPVRLGVYLRCWMGAQQLSRVYTPFTPFPQSESEKILLQAALRTQRCKQLFFCCFVIIACGSGGSVEPRCVGAPGVPVQLQFARTTQGATCDTTKWGMSNFSPSSAAARCSFGHCLAFATL